MSVVGFFFLLLLHYMTSLAMDTWSICHFYSLYNIINIILPVFKLIFNFHILTSSQAPCLCFRHLWTRVEVYQQVEDREYVNVISQFFSGVHCCMAHHALQNPHVFLNLMRPYFPLLPVYIKSAHLHLLNEACTSVRFSMCIRFIVLLLLQKCFNKTSISSLSVYCNKQCLT